MGVSFYSVGMLGVQLPFSSVFKDERVKRAGFEDVPDDHKFDPKSGEPIWETRRTCAFSSKTGDELNDCLSDGDLIAEESGLVLESRAYDGDPDYVYVGLKTESQDGGDASFQQLGPSTVEDVREAVKELFEGFGFPFKEEEFGLWVVTKAS